MLEEPRPEDVGGHFGEDAAFLLVLLAVGIVVIFARAVTAADTGVAGVTYNKTINKSNCFLFFKSIDVVRKRERERKKE